MHKKLIYLIIFLIPVVLVLPRPLSAQTNSPKRNELIPLRQATGASELSLPPGITRALNNISSRLKKTSDSLQRIQLRIENRLKKMKNNGVDTSKLEALAESIQVQIKKLISDLEATVKLKETLESSVNRKSALLAFRKQIAAVREDLLNIVKQQKNLVSQMKKLEIKPAITE